MSMNLNEPESNRGNPFEETWSTSKELSEDRLVRADDDAVSVRTATEKKSIDEQMVVVLQPLVKEPNRSLNRLYRADPTTIIDPIYIGTEQYKGVFVLQQTQTYENLSDSANSQRFSYVVNGFGEGNDQKFKEIRNFSFAYEELIPNLAKQRLANEFMAQLREQCAHLSIDSTASVTERRDYLSTSPIDMLIQTMLVLRNFDYSEHLQYIDVEIIKVELPKKKVNPVMPLEPSVTINLPNKKRINSDHLIRCRVTGNHVE